MRRLAILVVVLVCFFASASGVKASMITVNSKGAAVWNVLGESDSLTLDVVKPSAVSIKEINGNQETQNANIALLISEGTVNLNVKSEDQNKTLQLRDFSGDLVQVEQRPQVASFKIFYKDGNFVFKQGEISASTSYPVKIDSANARVSLQTPSGELNLGILPKDAVDDLVRAKVISKINGQQKIILGEQVNGQLAYNIPGIKTINLFNVTNLDVDVVGNVSATTGEILSVDQPVWLRILGFVFS